MNKQTLVLFHPQNWGVWLGFGLLSLTVTLLPYAILLRLGRAIGSLSAIVLKKRVHIVRRNLELAFPDMGHDEREKIVKENLKNTGLALIETGIAWFWPQWRFKRLIKYPDVKQILDLEKQKKGVLVVSAHALNLEIAARAFTTFAPGYGVYRPHNNPVYDYIQKWGRSRFGNQMIDRKNVKGMLKILRGGGRLWYLPDHDYGRKNSVFVPFFAVEDACTTNGSNILIDASHCAVVTTSGFRKGSKYILEIDEECSDKFPHKDPEGTAKVMNQAVEKIILRGLDQWMWVHKRFKTMEDQTLSKGCRYK